MQLPIRLPEKSALSSLASNFIFSTVMIFSVVCISVAGAPSPYETDTNVDIASIINQP